MTQIAVLLAMAVWHSGSPLRIERCDRMQEKLLICLFRKAVLRNDGDVYELLVMLLRKPISIPTRCLRWCSLVQDIKEPPESIGHVTGIT